MVKRFISSNASEILSMTASELKQSIKASEDGSSYQKMWLLRNLISVILRILRWLELLVQTLFC